MGRVFNVTGDPVDEQGPVKADKYNPIHRSAPPLVTSPPRRKCSSRALRSLTSSARSSKAGKSGALAARRGQDGRHYGTHQQHCQAARSISMFAGVGERTREATTFIMKWPRRMSLNARKTIRDT